MNGHLLLARVQALIVVNFFTIQALCEEASRWPAGLEQRRRWRRFATMVVPRRTGFPHCRLYDATGRRTQRLAVAKHLANRDLRYQFPHTGPDHRVSSKQ
jgi:hypothetical protein